MTSTRMRSLAGLALISTVVLTGCGSNPDFNPGVAARVGDDTVSAGTVRDVAADYCSAVESQLQGQPLANHFLNGSVASSLALRVAADQTLAEYDVVQDPSYDQAVNQALQSENLLGLDDVQAEALIEVQGSAVYVSAAQLAIGKSLLGGTASDEEAAAAGQEAFLGWLEDNVVMIDPKYGVAIEEGQAVPVDTNLSFPSSEVATGGLALEPDSAAAAMLAEPQRCG